MDKYLDDEQIVLVDEDKNILGVAPKLASHHATTPLHLAFSVYITNGTGKVLITRRALTKKVWPGVWTNSCCGHLAPKESTQDAVHRRVEYELGIRLDSLSCALPDYRYTTPAFNGVIENEVCPVFFGTTKDQLDPNSAEVADYSWVSWDELVNEALADTKDTWSWWCKDQVKQMLAKGLISDLNNIKPLHGS